MRQSPYLYALKYLSQKTIEINIYDIASAIVAETIFVQKSSNGDSDILGKYKNQVKSLSKLDRESLYQYIRSNSSEEWLKNVWEKTKKPWWYKSIDEIAETTISLQPFIDTVKNFEYRNNRPYPVGDEIICGKEIWPKECENEQKPESKIIKSNSSIDTSKNLISEICKLYDILVKARGGAEITKKFEYIWQWLISKSEYDSICETLKPCNSFENKQELLKNTKCVWVIVAYIAERYKREWNGYDGENNAILQIGLDIYTRNIAEQYFEDHLNRIFNPNDGNAQWLESLRMEGGLPIKYIVDKDKLDFTKDIYNNPLKAIEALEKTHNKTRIYSYNKKHSIYEYVKALIDKEEICSKEDADQYPFKDFQSKLEVGRKNASKFSVEYAVWRWRYSDEFVIHRQVNLKCAELYHEDQETISFDRIREVWQITEPTYVFWLRIGDKDYEFYKRNSGYRSATGCFDFWLPDLDLSSPESSRVTITYIPQGADGQKETNVSKWKDISNDIVEGTKKYILFSSKDGNRWYEGRNGDRGAILVLEKSVKIEPIGYVDEIQLDGGRRWVEFNTQIKINGKIESIGHLDVRPRSETLHPIAKLNYVHNIKLHRNNNIESIWLLKRSAIKRENFEKISDDNKSSLINKIEYYNNDSREYKPIDDITNVALDGLTKLRLDGKVIKVFALPEDANIQRDVGNERIIINNFNNVNINDIEGFVKTSNTYQKEFKYNDIDDPTNTTCQICINIDDSHKIVMDVVYPWRRKVCILGRNITTTERTVPRKFASKYKLLNFDEKGVNCIEDKESLRKYNRKIQKDRGQYRVELEEGVEFVFMTTSGKEYPLKVKRVEERTSVCYYLAGIPTEQEGVIFQSLKNKSSELAYYEHLLVGCKNRVVFHNNMSSKIAPFLKCEEHNLYYDVLLYKEMLTPKWFFDYCKDCIDQGRVINYKHLWQAAQDCEIDWILDFPRTEWVNLMGSKDCKCKKEWVIQLFRCHPKYRTNDLEEFVNKYWDLRWKCRAPQRESNEYKRFLFFVLKCELTYDTNGIRGVSYTDNNGSKREIKWEPPKKIPTLTDINIEDIIE